MMMMPTAALMIVFVVVFATTLMVMIVVMFATALAILMVVPIAAVATATSAAVLIRHLF